MAPPVRGWQCTILACVVPPALVRHARADAKPIQAGRASWYGPGFHGKQTANGERFNTHALTAAHRSLPFGSKVKVTNERTGRSVPRRDARKRPPKK